MASNRSARRSGAVPRRPWGIFAALLVLAAAPLGWYLLSPLVIDRAAPADPAAVADAATGTVVARGTFTEVDAIHKGEGRAVVTRLANGRYALRFEAFRVTNGPDLYVYLAGHPVPRSSAQLHEAGGVEIAVLKGNVGEQSYELPEGFDPDGSRSVVIYCQRFMTVFSTAELQRS